MIGDIFDDSFLSMFEIIHIRGSRVIHEWYGCIVFWIWKNTDVGDMWWDIMKLFWYPLDIIGVGEIVMDSFGEIMRDVEILLTNGEIMIVYGDCMCHVSHF